jgi:curved DNA-binding protein CbpA
MARLVLLAALLAAAVATDPQLVRSRREVEVNVKAMIYRILSRYPSKLAMYREVIQNSNDAGATSMTISLHRDDCGGHRAPCFVVQDDGQGFDDESWGRLITIASGNPDPNKVGGFGVGFYSVFSVTDTPIVQSNGQQLQFSWEGNELVAHKGPIKNNKFTSAPHTTALILPVGNITALVDQCDRNQFLVFLTKSLAFTTSLKEIKLIGLPSIEVFAVRKDITATIPYNYTNASSGISPNGIFDLDERTVDISEIKFRTSLQRGSEQVAETSASAVLVTASARMLHYDKNTSLTQYIYSKTGKKALPRQLPVAVLQPLHTTLSTAEAREACTGQASSDIAPCAFSPPGRLFVGFETAQTTGSSFHLDARFYATMDRDSIEMGQDGKSTGAHTVSADNPLMTFNADLLFMGGRVAKLALDTMLRSSTGLVHEDDEAMMATADDGLAATVQDDGLAATVQLLHGFAIDESTPNEQVADYIREGFFAGAVQMVLPCLQSAHTARHRQHLRNGNGTVDGTAELASTPWDIANSSMTSRTRKLVALCDVSTTAPLLLPPTTLEDQENMYQFVLAPLLPALLVTECPQLLRMLRRKRLVVRPRIDHVIVQLPATLHAEGKSRESEFVAATGAPMRTAQYYIQHYCDDAGYGVQYAVDTFNKEGRAAPPVGWTPSPLPTAASRPAPFHCTERFAAELLQWLLTMVRAHQLVGCSIRSTHLLHMLHRLVVCPVGDDAAGQQCSSLEHVTTIAPGTSSSHVADSQYHSDANEGLFMNVPLPPVALPQSVASRFTTTQLRLLGNALHLKTLTFSTWWTHAARNLSALARGHTFDAYFEGANVSSSWHSIPLASAFAEGEDMRFGWALRLLRLLSKQEDTLRSDERKAKSAKTTSSTSSMLSVMRGAEIMPDRQGCLRRSIDLYLPKVDVLSTLVTLPTVHPSLLRSDAGSETSVGSTLLVLTEGFLKLLGVRSSLHIKGVVSAHLAKEEGVLSYTSTSQLLLLLLRSASELSADEWDYLRSAPFMLPKDASAREGAGVAPTKLYLPTSELEAAGFAVAHFTLPSTGKDETPEFSVAQQLSLLRRLGVVETPDFHTLCRRTQEQQAAGGASALTALDYLAKHMHDYSDYNPAEPLAHAIIPALTHVDSGSNGGTDAAEPTAHKPSECYLEPNPLGLPVVVERYRQLAMLLGAQKRPPIGTVSKRALVLLCGEGQVSHTCTPAEGAGAGAGADGQCAEDQNSTNSVNAGPMMSADAITAVLGYLYNRLSTSNGGESEGGWQQKWSSIRLVPLALSTNQSLPRVHSADESESDSTGGSASEKKQQRQWRCEKSTEAFVATGRELRKAFDAIIPAAAASAGGGSGDGSASEDGGHKSSVVGQQCSHALVSAGALLDHGERVNGFLAQLGAYSLSFAWKNKETDEEQSDTQGGSEASGAINDTSAGAFVDTDRSKEPRFFFHSLLLHHTNSSRLGQLLRGGTSAVATGYADSGVAAEGTSTSAVVGEHAYCCMLGAAILPAAHLSHGTGSTGPSTATRKGFAEAMSAAAAAKWFRRLRDSPVVLAIDTEKQGSSSRLVLVMGRSCYLQDSDDELLRLANPRYVCAIPTGGGWISTSSGGSSGGSATGEGAEGASSAIVSMCRQSYEVLGARYLSDSIEFKHHRGGGQDEQTPQFTASASTEFLEELVQQRSSLVLFALRQKLLHSAAAAVDKDRVLVQVAELFKRMQFRHAQQPLRKELHFEGRLLRVDDTDAIASSYQIHNATILLAAKDAAAAGDEHSPSRLAAVSFEMAQLLSANTEWGVLTDTNARREGSTVLSLAMMRDCAQAIQFVLGSSLHTLKQLRYPVDAGREVEYAIDARELYLSKKKQWDQNAEEARKKKDFEGRKAAFEDWEAKAEDRAKTEAEEKAKEEAEKKAEKEAEEQERMVAEAQVRRKAEEEARKEAEEQAIQQQKEEEEEARRMEEEMETGRKEREASEAREEVEAEEAMREQAERDAVQAQQAEAEMATRQMEEELQMREEERIQKEMQRMQEQEELRQWEEEQEANQYAEEEARREEEEATRYHQDPPREVTLYTILGVDDSATLGEIKKAYRRLAVKWHPDKHQGSKTKQEAEDKFKYITAAYSVIGSKRKRARYDNYGDDGGMPKKFFKKYHTAEDVFNAFFGGEDPYDPTSSWYSSGEAGGIGEAGGVGSDEWAAKMQAEYDEVFAAEDMEDEDASDESDANDGAGAGGDSNAQASVDEEPPTPAPTMQAPTPVTPTPTPIVESEQKEEAQEEEAQEEEAQEDVKEEAQEDVQEGVQEEVEEVEKPEDQRKETAEGPDDPTPVSVPHDDPTPAPLPRGGISQSHSGKKNSGESFGMLELARTIECESSLWGTEYTNEHRGQHQHVSLAEHLENAPSNQRAVYYLDCSDAGTAGRELEACKGSPLVQALHTLEPAVEVLVVTRAADLAVMRLIEGGKGKKSRRVKLRKGRSFKLVQLTEQMQPQEQDQVLGLADLPLAEARCNVLTASSATVGEWIRVCLRSAAAAMAVAEPSGRQGEVKVKVKVLGSEAAVSGLPVHVVATSAAGGGNKKQKHINLHITVDEQAQLLQTMGQLKSSSTPRAQGIAKDMLQTLCRYAYARAHAESDSGAAAASAGAGTSMSGIFASISNALSSSA